MVLAQALPTALAAFLASLVEGVEALTVVLAVGSLRGWSGALAGTGAALLLLVALVALLGSALARVPLAWLQLVVGALLLLFGLRWLRKAILRTAGRIPLRDEWAAFQKQSAMIGENPASDSSALAFAASFQIVMLEGAEVVFIVIAVSAGGHALVMPASLGALAALLTVTILGLALHRPLSRIPENTLKFAVGVLLSAFGTFWVGEGLRLAWPGADASLAGLTAAYGAAASVAIAFCREHPAPVRAC